MEIPQARTVKKLGIAITIISALLVFVSVVGLAACAVSTRYMASEEGSQFSNELTEELIDAFSTTIGTDSVTAQVTDNAAIQETLKDLGIDPDDAVIAIGDDVDAQDVQTFVVICLIILMFGFGFLLISSILSLVAGLLAISRSKTPERFASAFVLAIVAAVLCFFTGRWPSFVLLIIAAVYENKARKIALAGGYSGNTINVNGVAIPVEQVPTFNQQPTGFSDDTK